MENWKPIPNHEGRYEASDFGRIRSVDRIIIDKNNKKIERRGVVLSQADRGRGYLAVNWGGRVYSVHRLIALTFIGESDKQVNHIDGNKKNNKIDNLEYCTPKENIRHSFKMGLQKPLRGEDSGVSKLNNDEVRSIKRLLSRGTHQKTLAKTFGVNQSIISEINTGKIWSHIK